jgi:hypothetical protein
MSIKKRRKCRHDGMRFADLDVQDIRQYQGPVFYKRPQLREELYIRLLGSGKELDRARRFRVKGLSPATSEHIAMTWWN